MTKIDLKKDLSHLYNPSSKVFSLVEVPPLNFLMSDGQGNPNTAPEYSEVVSALYSLSYSLKFALKAKGYEYGVMPLEGLWWMENMAEFSEKTKDRWEWTMMIMQPEAVTPDLVEQVRAELVKKKDLPALPKVSLAQYAEGLSAQILYFGPYAGEGPTIARMHAFIAEQGYQLTGKHHEIYLSDPGRTAPEKLKTIIRQPVCKV